MLIAPTKMSTLWNTPILPILFCCRQSWWDSDGNPGIHLRQHQFWPKSGDGLLTPMARMIPWFLGAYGAVKIADLVVRYNQLNLLEHPAATTSLAIEILLGVVAPFLLFLNKAVRRSMAGCSSLYH